MGKDIILELFKGEEVKLTEKELNAFIWKEFIGEEEDLTDEEKKYWEVIK